ncbi:peptidase inhibitor family I36 protein [Streptomyces sp. NPDC000410]|uniref:peptidase inhibitor family I36 protein n=1 Tax=Streptomyces sp. NPDC000410 TaxID=3154254 RepID=UPI0033182D49
MWLQAGPAQAAYADCPEKKFCLYTGSGGNGEMVAVSPRALLDYGNDPALKDKAFVSFRNNTAYWACLYDDPSYGGTEMQSVLPAHSGADLPRNQAGEQKVTPASHKFAKSKAGCRTGFERCDAGRVCIFQEPSGRGVGGVAMQTEDLGDGVLGNRKYSATWDNKLVSVANRSQQVACFYPEPGYTWEDGQSAFQTFVVLPGRETSLPGFVQRSVSSHKLADSEAKC